MFDLEGLPPHFDELQKVYLWGMQVFGETPSDYICSTAGLATRGSSPTVKEGSTDGDRQGWEGFLAAAHVSSRSGCEYTKERANDYRRGCE